MLRLPAHLSPYLRELFDELSAVETIDQFLSQFAERLARLTACEFAVGTLEIVDRLRNEPTQLFVDSTFATMRALHDGCVATEWFSSAAHEQVTQYLKRSSTAAVFEAGAWPFEREMVESLALPNGMAVVVPFSSIEVFVAAEERRFSGYILLIANPQARGEVHLVKELQRNPGIISQFISARLRSGGAKADALGEFAHNIKHSLMVIEELLRMLQNPTADVHQRAQLKLEKVMKRALLETTTVLLADKDDSGSFSVSTMPISLSEVTAEAIAEARVLFEVAQVRLDLQLDVGLSPSPVDPAIFPAVVHNLLDNALKYSIDGSVVSVRTNRSNEGMAVLTVTNTAQPLPPEELENLFRRNFRASNSRSIAGSGLGLYLVKRIAEAHGGTVSVTCSESGVVEVKLQLPFSSETDDHASDWEVRT